MIKIIIMINHIIGQHQKYKYIEMIINKLHLNTEIHI